MIAAVVGREAVIVVALIVVALIMVLVVVVKDMRVEEMLNMLDGRGRVSVFVHEMDVSISQIA